MVRKYTFDKNLKNSWKKIAPSWSLKNLIAVNPASGFEDINFKEALKKVNIYFQQKALPKELERINLETIKWLQVFFDEGQSTIKIPLKNMGLLKSVLTLISFDKSLLSKNSIKNIPININQESKKIISDSLIYLDISKKEQEEFFTLLLTTLPGWSSYIQYKSTWTYKKNTPCTYEDIKSEYIALRLVLTCIIWPQAKDILLISKNPKNLENPQENFNKILKAESEYQEEILSLFTNLKPEDKNHKYDAQFVFCIDVRSEPFRRALENVGNYKTFGFAGFFGLPVAIENPLSKESHLSCPVLLDPIYKVKDKGNKDLKRNFKKHKRSQGIKTLYQSMKYTFTTPFYLVEAIGLISGLWMGIKSLFPKSSNAIRSSCKYFVGSHHIINPDISSIDFKDQVNYASNALNMMGLTENFSPFVIFCGHGSSTQNNAYGTSLDCGACAGHNGSPNACMLASILNSTAVRKALEKEKIFIPKETTFLGAKHNTTTDECHVYNDHINKNLEQRLTKIKKDLESARENNTLWRIPKIDKSVNPKNTISYALMLSQDWAQTRPEWGLSRNAAFVIGPRWITKNENFEGRIFLHSYEWEKDNNGKNLEKIMTAPMIVAQWINAQYLFSTLDNIAFGGGSKVTKNVTGKIGIMQGNASDLMHGLPLQSVYETDKTPYHQTVRLTVIIYAQKKSINKIIKNHDILKRLFGNEWIHLICIEPNTFNKFKLNRDFEWKEIPPKKTI